MTDAAAPACGVFALDPMVFLLYLLLQNFWTLTKKPASGRFSAEVDLMEKCLPPDLLRNLFLCFPE
jgi:hypothetical protein